MKLKNTLSWLLIATSILILSACGGGSSSSSDEDAIIPPPPTAEVIPPAEPDYPNESSLTINLKDATDSSGITGALVKIEGPIIATTSATGTSDAAGKVVFSLDQSQFTDLNKDGIADEAKEVTVLISGDAILSRSMKMLVTNYGENFKDIQVVNLASGVEPEGITIVSEDVNLNSDPDAVIDDVPVMIVEAQTGSSTATAVPSVVIPTASTFISNEGVELDESSLSVEVVAFDVNSENAQDLLSVGTSYEIKNPSALADDLGVDATETQNVAVALMGVISVNIVDAAGNEAIGVIGTHPVALNIPIAANMLNPETGRFVAEGDTLALLSLSEDTNAWNYEGEYTVTTDTSGYLIIQYETTHFSSMAVGNVKPAQCSGSINIITEYNQPYSDIGNFRLQGSYIGDTIPYNGEGRLSYTDLTDEPLKIIFTPIEGSARILSEGTTVDGTIETDSPIIYDVYPCAADGKNIVFEALVAPVPTIYISKYFVSSQSSATITEGGDSAFTVTLENPPVNQAVSFSIKSNDNLSDDLVISQQRYTFDAGTTSIDIPYSAIDDALIEGTESFRIEFYDADNGAVFAGAYGVTNSSFVSTVFIIDNDRLLVNDMNYTAIEEDNTAIITFHLNEAVPEYFTQSVYMYVRAYSDNTTDATEMLDFDSKTLFRPTYTSYSSYSVKFEKGSSEATLEIPLFDDPEVDQNETFLIDMRSYVVGFDISETQVIQITDNDTQGNTTAYSVEFVRFGSDDSRLDANSMWEGEVSWLKVTLDKATNTPLKITYDAPANSNYTLSGNGELLFDQFDATKYIAITSIENYVTGSDIDLTVTFDANTSITGPADANVTIRDDDFDYIYIDARTPSGEISAYEEYVIQPSFFVVSNYSNLMIDYVTEGDEQVVAGAMVYTEGGSTSLVADPLVDIDDEIVKAPRTYVSTSTLSDDPINTGSTNFVTYIYGSTDDYLCRSLWNPTSIEYNACKTFTQTISVVDNDKYLFAIETPPSVLMDIYQGTPTTTETSVTLTLTSDKLDREVSFDGLDGEPITLTGAVPKKDFVVDLIATPLPNDADLTVGATGVVQFTVDLTMTDESETELQDANLSYKLDTIVVIDINYTIIADPVPDAPTGSEGGS